MQNKQRVAAKLAAGAALLALVGGGLLAGGGLKVWAGETEKGEADEIEVALPANQIITSIRTAVAAKSGRVLEVTAERKKGKTNCNVEVVGEDGKTYAVVVDVAANKVTAVESEDDEDAKDGK